MSFCSRRSRRYHGVRHCKVTWLAGRYRLQDNSANVVGGVNDEYAHRVPSRLPQSFSVELRQILRKFGSSKSSSSIARPLSDIDDIHRIEQNRLQRQLAIAPAKPPSQRSARPARVRNRHNSAMPSGSGKGVLSPRNTISVNQARRLDNGARGIEPGCPDWGCSGPDLCPAYREPRSNAGTDAVDREAVIVAQRLGFGQIALANKLHLVINDLSGLRQGDLVMKDATDIDINCIAHQFV